MRTRPVVVLSTILVAIWKINGLELLRDRFCDVLIPQALQVPE
jgi:hypothetical protein